MTPNPAHPAEPGASGLAADIERVVKREHPDPHHVLGAHPSNGGVVLRAFRPAAERVLARPYGGDPVALE
ncbi:MAG: GlgB N-terminal domain-containing protein, partial [Thermoleophilaceae bacterium]